VLPRFEGPLGFDKFQHFLAYFILTAAITLWFSREKWLCGAGVPVFSAALGSLYGLIDEIHQHFVPGRNSDIQDWAFDTLGAAVAVTAVKLAFVCWRRIQRKTETERPFPNPLDLGKASGDFNRE
jgi:VanZ family protein